MGRMSKPLTVTDVIEALGGTLAASELFGVTPDVVCLAKAICGGLPGGAVGMTDELGALVASGQVRQQGTAMVAEQGVGLDRMSVQSALRHQPGGRG